MDFTDLVKHRYSVRKYIHREVPKEMVEKCMEAAQFAPSACNSQPWFFMISMGYEKSIPLAETAFSGAFSMNAFARTAPVIITVITEPSKYTARLGGLFRGVQFSLLDIGIACEHISLQATEMGLGTCWFGWFNEGSVKKQLGLKGNIKIDLLLSLGYPASENIPPKYRKGLDMIRKYV